MTFSDGGTPSNFDVATGNGTNVVTLSPSSSATNPSPIGWSVTTDQLVSKITVKFYTSNISLNKSPLNVSVDIPRDLDNDGIPDYHDLDSDGDGCSDQSEITSTSPVAGSYYDASTKACIGDDVMNIDKGGSLSTTVSAFTNDKSSTGTTANNTNSTITAGSGWPSGITLNTDGTITITKDVTNGTYNLPYTLCSPPSGTPQYCTTATITLTVTGTVPVTFGNITATAKNEMLYVNWSTLSETNFKYFDVEASTNGKNFVKIGSVDSKSVNGNSAEELQYSFSKNISETQNLLGLHVNILAVIAFLLFLSSVVWAATHTRSKKGNIAIVVLMGIVLSAAMFACSKGDAPASIVKGKLYIRIVTHDINGDSSSSKVIEAVQE